MNRKGSIVSVLLLAFSTTSCMTTIRDRLAMRYGLMTKQEKVEYLARHKSQPAWQSAEKAYLAVVEKPKRPYEETFFVASPVYPKIEEKSSLLVLEKAQENELADLRRFSLEREAARLRWEAGVMRMEAKDLQQKLFALDTAWKDMSEKVAHLEEGRGALKESLAKVEAEIEKTRSQAAEIEASGAVASASSAGNKREPTFPYPEAH